MNTYLILKFIHVSCVILSVTGFTLRGFWMMTKPHMLTQKWVKILPHIIDSALLASALTLAFYLSLNPLQHHWLMAKIVALVVYIGLGAVALKHGKTRSIRISAFIAALLVLAYIVLTAISKSPLM